MTIEKQPPGLWFACCDQCGVLVELDTDPDDEFTDAVAEVKELGWRICPPETVKYAEGHDLRRNRRVTYWTHLCPDCRREAR
jgi:hypothetical protein